MLFASMPDASEMGRPVLLNRNHLTSSGGMVLFFSTVSIFFFRIFCCIDRTTRRGSSLGTREPSDPARCRSHHPPASPPGLTGRCCERTGHRFCTCLYKLQNLTTDCDHGSLPCDRDHSTFAHENSHAQLCPLALSMKRVHTGGQPRLEYINPLLFFFGTAPGGYWPFGPNSWLLGVCLLDVRQLGVRMWQLALAPAGSHLFVRLRVRLHHG